VQKGVPRIDPDALPRVFPQSGKTGFFTSLGWGKAEDVQPFSQRGSAEHCQHD